MKKVVVFKQKIAANFENITKYTGDKPIYAVLKSNAYGLDLLKMATELRELGIDRFALTEPEDALFLRVNGFNDEEILIIRTTCVEADLENIIRARAVASIGSPSDALKLNNLSAKYGIVSEVHIKIDTGLGRYGFEYTETDAIADVFSCKNLRVTGIYTHLANATDKKYSDLQTSRFNSVLSFLRERGFDPGTTHVAASSSVFARTAEGYDAVRVGSAFFGTNPTVKKYGAQQVFEVQTDIAEIRSLSKGHVVGYSNVFVTKKLTKMALLPFGASDGYPLRRRDDIFSFRAKLGRAFHTFLDTFKSQKITATVNGQKAKTMGHIGMNHIALDVSKIECQPGDTVILDAPALYLNRSIEREYK